MEKMITESQARKILNDSLLMVLVNARSLDLSLETQIALGNVVIGIQDNYKELISLTAKDVK